MVKSDSYSVSVTFGKAVYEAHQRTCTHTFETLEQLKTSQASTDTINFYKNMVRIPCKKFLSTKSEYDQEIPQSYTADQQNTYIHKTSGRQIK